jgi:hypothetical protein
VVLDVDCLRDISDPGGSEFRDATLDTGVHESILVLLASRQDWVDTPDRGGEEGPWDCVVLS